MEDEQNKLYETGNIIQNKPQELYKLPQNYFSNNQDEEDMDEDIEEEDMEKVISNIQ